MKKNVVIGSLLINIVLIVVLVLTLSNNYFISKELNNITSKCYEIGGTAKLEIQDISKGEYHFECIKE